MKMIKYKHQHIHMEVGEVSIWKKNNKLLNNKFQFLMRNCVHFILKSF